MGVRLDGVMTIITVVIKTTMTTATEVEIMEITVEM